jgi:hypothetical protein
MVAPNRKFYRLMLDEPQTLRTRMPLDPGDAPSAPTRGELGGVEKARRFF